MKLNISNAQKAAERIMDVVGDYSERKRIMQIIDEYFPEPNEGQQQPAPIDNFMEALKKGIPVGVPVQGEGFICIICETFEPFNMESGLVKTDTHICYHCRVGLRDLLKQANQ